MLSELQVDFASMASTKGKLASHWVFVFCWSIVKHMYFVLFLILHMNMYVCIVLSY